MVQLQCGDLGVVVVAVGRNLVIIDERPRNGRLWEQRLNFGGDRVEARLRDGVVGEGLPDYQPIHRSLRERVENLVTDEGIAEWIDIASADQRRIQGGGKVALLVCRSGHRAQTVSSHGVVIKLLIAPEEERL